MNEVEEVSTFLSYEKLFEVCFYYRRKAIEKCGYDLEE